jgi:hypothetical protein
MPECGVGGQMGFYVLFWVVFVLTDWELVGPPLASSIQC